MQWGPETDAKLFMHVIAIGKVKLDYQALAIAMGNNCTPKAIRHRMAKLRAQAAEQSTAASTLPTTPNHDPPMHSQNPSTPPSTAAISPASTTATVPTPAVRKITSGKNGKLGAASGGSKRTAGGKVKAGKGSAVKMEEEDGDEEVEVEGETPRKKAKNSSLNVDCTTRRDEIAG